MLKKITFALILLIFPYSLCLGNLTTIDFDILKSESFQTGEISDLYQDSEGYIWIVANDGLERYDGHNSIPFISLKSSEEILGSQLHTIIEGEKGFLYVATERGLIKLNKITAEAHLVKDKIVERINISSMAKDKDGRIWIGGDKGLIMKNAGEEEYTKIDLWTGTKSISDITSVIVDSSNNLWFTIWYDGLYRYDLSNGKFFKYSQGSLDRSYTVHQDSNGNIWVGTWGKGLVKISAEADLYRENIEYTLYTHKPNDYKSLIDDTIYKIKESPEGNIWIGSRSGLSILDPRNDNHTFVNYLPGDKKGDLPYNEVNCLLRTKDNSMFVGMMGGGVCKAEKEQKSLPGPPMDKIQKRFNTSSIYGMSYNSDGSLWLGIASHGPVKFDAASGDFKYYLDIPLFKGYFGTSTVEEIIYSRDSTKIYFASYNRGLWIHDIVENSVTVINTTTCPELKDDCLYSLCEDYNGYLWIGTKKGVYIMNPYGKIYSLAEYIGTDMPASEVKATDISCDTSGDIWVATAYSGILRINTSERKLKIYRNSDYSESDSFISILADSKGNVRAGSTRDGLYRYDPEEDRMIKENSLVFLNTEEVVNLSEDPHGHIWVTTQTSVISFVDDEKGAYSELRYWNISEDGKARFFNNNSSVWLKNTNEMAFGTSNGILTFPCLSNDCAHNEECKIALTNIKSTDGKLTLAQGSTELTVNFSLFNYQRPSGDIYRYRLYRGGQERDNTWFVVNGDHNFAHFKGLKPGRYIFEVYGSQAGSFSNSEIASLNVVVPRNPWTSWWAVILYILVCVSIIFLILFSIISHFRLAKKEEIDRLTSQKKDELNQNKLRFITNVSNEFLTPINLILTSVENLFPKDDRDKEILRVLSTNAVRLMRMIQQVLEFRKSENENLELKVLQGDIARFAEDCTEAFIPLIRKGNLRISFKADPQEIIGYFDADKVDKIIYCLISNAIKHALEDSTIVISMRLLCGDKLSMSITFEGEPMSDNTIKGLFRRFYETENSKFNHINSEFGLSIVKPLIELHKGDIMVESNEAIGNRFIVTIPLAKEAYSSEEIDENTSLSTEVNIPMPTTYDDAVTKEEYTVLIVENNEDYRTLLEAILSRRFEIITCQDAETALNIVADKKIDLIVSVIEMPGMKGTQLCSELKNKIEYSHIPVILLSDNSNDATSIEVYKCGADGYLNKQNNFSVLTAMIVNFFKKQEKKSKAFRKQMILEIQDIEYTSMDKKFLQQAIDTVDAHISDSEFGLSEFSSEMSMSRTILTEKLKRLTGLTPMAFILNARLTMAYKIATTEPDKIMVSDLAYSLGFSDPKYFSKRFKIKYGKSPKAIMEEKKIKTNEGLSSPLEN